MLGRILKTFRNGTHRTVAPAETLERVRPLLRRFGITRVACVTGLDCVGIDTVMVVRPNSRSISVAQGKGASLDAAKASGIMEAIELHVAEHFADRPDAPLRAAAQVTLGDAHRVIDVSRMPAGREPYRPEDTILWAEAVELGTGDPLLVPYEAVHFDLTLPLPPGSGRFLLGTSGLASGNGRSEATSHALCELIERDATTLFYELSAAEQASRRIDLTSVDDQGCLALVEKFRRAGIAVAAWDVTSDVGVACVLCAVVEERTDLFRPVGLARGAGCHLDPRVALSRALCEAAQSRLTRIAGARDDVAQRDVDNLRDPATIERHRAQLAQHGEAGRRLSDLPDASTDAHDRDVALLQRRLGSVGLDEIAVVDLTPPDVPFSVVRAIVPGLEPPSETPDWRPGPRARRVRGER